jgi:hypothetical protein
LVGDTLAAAGRWILSGILNGSICMRRTHLVSMAFKFAIAFTAALMAAQVCWAADAPSDTSKTDTAKADASKNTLKVIKPEEVKDYEGQEVIVEFTVAAGRELDNGENSVCFLNSTTDRSDPAGFTAFISKAGLAKFKENPATAKPAEYFPKKKIRVTGKIVVYQKKYEIKVDDTDQIDVVEEKADANAEKKS